MFRRILSPRQNRSQSSVQLNSQVPSSDEEVKNSSYGDPDKLNSPVRSQSMVASLGAEMNPPLPPRNMRHQDSESALYVSPADTLRNKPASTTASPNVPSGAGSSHTPGNVDAPADAHPTKSEWKVMQLHQLTKNQRKACVTPASASNGHQRTHSFGNVTEKSDYSVPYNLVQANERTRPPLKPPRVVTHVRPERHDSSERIIPINPPSATSPQPPSDRSNTNSPSSPMSNQSSEQEPPGPPPPRQTNGESDYDVPWDRSKYLQNIPHKKPERKPQGRRKEDSGFSEESSGSISRPREDVQLHQQVRTEEVKVRGGSVREHSPPLPSRGAFRYQSAREPMIEFERESSPPPPELPFDPLRPHRNRAVSDRVHRREGSTSPVGGSLRSRVEDMGLHSQQSAGPHRGQHLPDPPSAFPPPPPLTREDSWIHSGPPNAVSIDISIPLEDQP